MQEIQRGEYPAVMPLFANIPHQRPVVFSVLEGRQPGRVFADEAHCPSAAVILADYSYIGGQTAPPGLVNEVAGLLLTEVFQRTEHVLLYALSEVWMTALRTHFAFLQPQVFDRTRFVFDPGRYRELHAGWRDRIPAGFSLRRIDAETVGLLDGIAYLWGSTDNFLRGGFGFAAFRQHEGREDFASSAHAVFVGGGYAEIGIGTREEFQRRGLATAVGCAFIDHCLENGLYPEWTCMFNEASEKLAYRIGYTARQDVPFIYVHSPEELRGMSE